jgi:hypothetical protein
MESKNGNNPLWLTILRWVARIVAILFIAFILIMFIGEGGFTNFSQSSIPLQARDYIILSLFGLYILGLVVGLVWEGLGGLISFGFMMTFIIVLVYYGKVPILFYIFFLPSILFILSWYLHQSSEFPE